VLVHLGLNITHALLVQYHIYDCVLLTLHTNDSNTTLPSQIVDSTLMRQYSVLISTVRERSRFSATSYQVSNARMAIVSDCSYRGTKENA
jgi:hypothetical protein